MITKTDGQFQLRSKGSGKNMGKFRSKGEAVKREKQVQFFKHKKA